MGEFDLYKFRFREEEEESGLQYDCVLVSVTLPTPNHTVSRFLLHLHENEICIKQIHPVLQYCGMQ